MTTLEAVARQLWVRWGSYAKHTACASCDEHTYCRSKNGKRFVCLPCFDQGAK